MSQKEEVSVNHVHTICKECVFAKWEKNTQTGCKLDRINDYEKAGVNIVGIKDEEDKEYFVIDGRYCVYYRNTEIMKDYPRDTWEEIVNLQVKVPYHAMVIVNEEDDFKTVKKCCKALKNQKYSPNLVTLINKQYPKYVREQDNAIPPSKLLQLLKDSEFHQFSFKNIYDQSLDDRALVDLVFDSAKENKYPFYVVFNANFDIPQEFSEEFNNSILVKMMQVGFAKPVDDINGMIGNRVAHKKHSGNSFGRNLEDKIINLEDDGEKFVFEIGDVCPCLKK